MTKRTWLSILIPIQFVLLISQLLTGFNAKRMPWGTYEIVHEGGGILLVTLLTIHLVLNWDWVRATYRGRAPWKR